VFKTIEETVEARHRRIRRTGIGNVCSGHGIRDEWAYTGKLENDVGEEHRWLDPDCATS
jgi:hypothetical protein